MKVPGDNLIGHGNQQTKQNPIVLWMGKVLGPIVRAINGNLTFGGGVYPDNIAGKWMEVADTGSADTEFAVQHDLGVIPPGFLLMVPPEDGFVYKGTTAWTTSNIYLKCSGANQAVTIFILLPPLT